MNLLDRSGAMFSACRRYRYSLWREWLTGAGTVNFLMLNPSTADEVDNDPTVERCERRARDWGFARLIVTNLFAFRATFPREMMAAEDPVGPENDAAILDAACGASRIVCAWGEDGAHQGRSAAVRRLLRGRPLCALRVNRSGEPAHPLYLPYSLKPEPWGTHDERMD